MKTRTEPLPTINHKNWQRLVTLAIALATLLPLPLLVAETPATQAVAKQELRNSNGDLLPQDEIIVPRRKWSLTDLLLTRFGMDPFSRDAELANRAVRSPNGTTGVSTWTGGTGNWSNGAMWNPVNSPNDAGADVLVDGGNTGTNSVVTIDGAFLVGRLTIDAGDSVAISNGNNLQVTTGAFAGSGNIVNNGSLSLNSTGNTTSLFLIGTGGLTLSGSGTLTLGSGGPNQISGGSFSALFTNQSTIQGAGSIGAGVIDVNNQSLIDANLPFTGSNSLLLNPVSTFTNSGTLRASNGGLLRLGAASYANAGGTILATGTGSIVQLESNAVVSGGTLATASGGLIQAAPVATVTLSGVTNTGAYSGPNNSDTYLTGTITNSGTMTLNSTGNTTRFLLNSSGATLSGGGNVILGSAATANQISGNAFNALLTNQNNTISGVGNIGVNIIDINNQGLIDANVTYTGTNPLVIDATSTVTNTGTLRASNGGLLDLGGGTYANAGGIILATGTGSIVQLDNQSAINGGTLSTSAGGLIQAAPGFTTTLSGVTNTGAYSGPNNSDTFLVGTITNSGTMTLNSTGNTTRFMLGASPATLTGGGSVVLGSGTTANQISGTNFNTLLTNQNNTISGVGNIGVNIIDINNQSLIDANVTYTGSNSLVIDPTSTVTNTGTLRASNGGLLDLGGGTYANTGGTILATGTNSIVQLDNASVVSGGTLATSLGGVIQTGGGLSTTLNGVTNTGTYQALNNSDTRISGTINNSGTMTLRAAGNVTRLVVPGAAGSNTTLTGGGSIILSDSLGLGNQITGDNFNNILTNQNNTISGVGNIGVNVIDIVNQSLIDANVPYAVASHTLLLDPTATLTNTGTLRASNGGFLELGGGTYANTGGTILATGTNSIVQLDNAALVSGGTLATSGGGIVQTAAGITVSLDSVSNTGNYQFLNNSDTRLFGTINNSGTMTLRSAGNSVRLVVIGAAGTNVTLTGGGNLVLDDSLGTNNQITGDNFNNILTNQDNTISGAGNVGVNVLNIVNGGVINADRANALVIDPNATATNSGTFRGSGSGGLFLAGGTYTNSGTFEALNGSSVFMDASTVLTNNMAGVLTGGTYRAIATGVGATLTIRGSDITQIAANTEVDLSGAGSVFQNASTPIESTLLSNLGVLRILGNRNYTNTNALSNGGTLELGGGIFDAPGLTNGGELFGFGIVTPRPTNSGLIRAVGGTLAFTNGIQGGSGTVQIDSTGVLNLSSSSLGSSADFLTNNGNANPSLMLGSQNFTVGLDYTNSHFGVGNTFNPRANVSGTGLINAAGNVAQTLSGNLTNGATTTPTMAFGNVHVGDSNTRNFQVNNTGSSGPSLRGALQTSVNGGNITDGRLSGTGVTASNFGPIALGANTGNLGVTFNATSAGALVSQVLHVVNNFDNVAEQNLSITGAAYRYASPTGHSPEPIAFGNFHVGDTAPIQILSITNNVPNDTFSEALNASIGSPTGGVTTNAGSFNLLAPGATNNTSLSVGISTASAGSKNGTATISLQSDGTGSSGLGITTLTSQTVNVTGSVFRLAAPNAHSPEPVVLANQHVGDNITQAISLTNTATNDGFSEKLDAGFTATNGNATASGSFALLGPGATNNTSLLVGVDTSSAGARSGTATIGLTSDGNGTSGLANSTLTSQTVSVSGNVYRLASPSTHSPEPINFGVHHIGDSVSNTLVSLTNNAPNDGFSESLNASIGSATGGVTTNSGSFTGLAPNSTNNTSLGVSINTSTAGNKNGTATISLASNGSGSSGLGLSTLTSQTVNVTGQVNYFADPVIIFKMGAATLTMNSATSFTLNFGQVAQNTGTYMASFGVQNTLHDATFQDSLGGTFDVSAVTNFILSGFSSFSGIASGSALDPGVGFNSSQSPGTYTNFVTLSPSSSNASGTSSLSNIQLSLVGQIIVVPEPNTWAILVAGGGMLVAARRFVRRRH